MHASPDAGRFAAFLARARRRSQAVAALRGSAVGFGLAAIALLAGAHRGSAAAAAAITAALVVVGVVIAATMAARQRVSHLIEQRTPGSRNLVFTAAELIERPDAAAPYIATRVLRDATQLTSSLDLRQIIPSRTAAIALTAGLVAWSGAIVIASYASDNTRLGPSSERAATILGIDIEVTPPDYAARPSQVLHDPARIEVLAGSRLRVTVTADAADVTIDTISASLPLAVDGRTFSTTVLADADGYLAFAPKAANGSLGARRLVGLSVTPDQAPRVRLTAPGKDMIVRNGQFVLPFAIEADDDLGLASLKLLYTRISGSGENFTFTEGEVPVTITRASDRSWSATGSWALAPLKLEPGDMVIYRGAATDRRPGSPPAESDRFIVEIAAPGAMAGEGFAIDDRLDKYAISQQMVILNTERLLAKRATLPEDDYRREAEGVAAEQRQVRAEFVFMLGGELADLGVDLTTLNEEVEAAGEADLAAGRMANQGRTDLLRAIRFMSVAAARLAERDLTAALPTEREALTYLQRAFSRSRYLLRTLSERERLDLSRRLTGVLAALDRSSRPAAEPPPNPRVMAVRRALAEMAALAADANRGSTGIAARATALAEQVLRIDPSSAPLRDVATAITQASWDRAATGLAAIARASLPADPAHVANPELDALAGALADALRRRGRQP
jgi:hypothetical protein